MNDVGSFIRAGTLDELRSRGRMVLGTPGGAVLVVAEGENVVALDNRCPHMGFPLHRGSVEDGILTCHWHHARFDLRSGSTFDLWADDVPLRAVRVVDGEVWVAATAAPRDEATHWRRRLHDGLTHNISLVIGKAVLGATAAGIPATELVRDALLYGAAHRDRWGVGLTTLMAAANLMPMLDDQDRFLALFHGIAAVADDCEGEAPRSDTEPLGGTVPFETLARWFRHWVRVRHRTGAERTLRTAIVAGATPQGLAATILIAVTDRYFADGGHALDFAAKAFEAVDLAGWKYADAVLPSIVPVLTASIGGEEMDSWRHPVDLIGMAERAQPEFAEALAAGRSRRGGFRAHAVLGRGVLGDDPEAIFRALVTALHDGAAPADVARAVAFAAALRIAHFGTSNDHSDWETAHHAFSYANAAFALMVRATDGAADAETEALCLRAAVHGALAVYLARYLNVPPARLPRGGERSLAPGELRRAFLDACDRQQQVLEAAQLAASHLAAGYPAAELIALLGHALLREDAGFHMMQNLQAAVHEYLAWHGEAEAAPILIAAARYLAAHSPTLRARRQTADVARRLMRGSPVHENDAALPDQLDRSD
ncbi:MAG TPA: Rieske (2Fe-2S) protein [Xanthobacteraceae bacterium]|jgi:nitrite reductase/ring-hydroxylating ferredoxin subunit